MNGLAYKHPAQLVLGAVMIGEELATKNRQTTFAVICRDAVEWAVETRDLLREIACDAGYGVDLVADVAVDGRITRVEAGRLADLFREIETEAREGRVISGSSFLPHSMGECSTVTAGSDSKGKTGRTVR